MAGSWDEFEPAPRAEPRAHEFGRSMIRWADVAGGFGTLMAGTLLCMVNGGEADGQLRPFAYQTLTEAQSGNEVEVADVRCFREGDSVLFLQPLDADPYLSHNADGAGKYVNFEAVGPKAVRLSVVDPSANSQSLTVTTSAGPDENTVAVVVSLATSGAGAITSTLAQVIAAILNSAANTYLFAALATDGGAEVFDGVLAATTIPTNRGVGGGPALVTTAREVTAVDPDANTITVDGASMTLPRGTVAVGVEADAGEEGSPFTFVGITLDQVRTFTVDENTGVAVPKVAKVHYAHGGIFKPSKAIGFDDTPHARAIYRGAEAAVLAGQVGPDTFVLFAPGE